MAGTRRYSKRGGSNELYELGVDSSSIRIDEQKSDTDDSEEFQQSNDSSGSRTLTDRKKNPDAGVSKHTRRALVCIQGVIGVSLFAIVLICSVLSKLSLLSITDHLRQLTWDITPKNGSGSGFRYRSEAAGLYWQLFFIMVLPNCVTFVRSFIFGVFGKTKESYPWPSRLALVGGISIAILEVFTISTFVFLVLSYLPPNISILILSGVFFVQICIDIKRAPWKPAPASRHQYHNLEMEAPVKPSQLSLWLATLKEWFRQLLENRTVKIVALVLQAVGILVLTIFLGVKKRDIDRGGSVAVSKILRPVIALPIALLIISFIWSDKVQKLIAHTNHIVGECRTARYKSSFINSGIRVFLYPFVSYIVFRYFTSHHIDPWCIDGDHCNIDFSWTRHSLAVFLVQIFATFFGYWFAWIACTMTLHWLGMALPLLLSTPITIVWYYLSYYEIGKQKAQWFPFYGRLGDFSEDHVHDIFLYAPFIAMLLWFGQTLAMGYYIWTRSNLILSKDTEMFLIPHYDGVFFEQQLMLNRQTNKDDDGQHIYHPSNTLRRNPRTIFICSTMYRENDIEMEQMLMSIHRIAQLHEKQAPDERDHYESHIFFDGSLNGTQLTHFALQLVSLLEDTLHVKLTECDREETPYGCKLSWFIGMDQGKGMPFCIHMKDNLRVKNKKRWSQVMYMSYVLKYRIEKDDLDPDNTFILTTDADIDFTADSAVVLLDMLASNPKVGAVCARTHPKGSGPLYWYQIFDYAVGHWFMKPAEHILGCVLCCPGCFSVFRCRALMETLEIYSSEVSGASEFLTKDMGEDRWLCTLLIEKGWRLEYCAISEDYTYCPESFDEFFKQRRRWVPSTLANLMLLISQAGSITRGNDTVSVLFILFQAIIVFSTAISPATVILTITSGLGSAYGIPDGGQITIIVLLVLVSVGYGMICIYTSQKTQLDIAKLLTFIFAIVMAIVIAGIFKSTIDDIFPSRKITLLNPASCPQDGNGTKELEDCLKAAKFIASQKNATGDLFELPVSVNTMYTAAFGVTFILAAILHLPEWTCLLHFIWYLLALPAGYLLLLIYSAANVNSMSWGTREKTKGEDLGGYALFLSFLKELWVRLMTCFNFCCCVKNKEGKGDPEKPQPQPPPEQKPTQVQNPPSAEQVVKDRETLQPQPQPQPQQQEQVQSSTTVREHTVPVIETAEAHDPVHHPPMEAEAVQWLQSLYCERYVPNFEKHGYKNLHFIASMTSEDFEAIGIDKRGLRLRLEKAAQWLHSLPIETSTVRDVDNWLRRLELQEYKDLFSKEGYSTADDIGNLKGLQERELREMGIHKRAHLQRLLKALDVLFPNRAEPYDPVQHPPMEDAAVQWLKSLGCERYVPNFEKHGYKNRHFIASMTYEDFAAVGIDRRGLRLRLEKAAKTLPSLPIETMVPRDVDDWLKRHELQEYKELFSKEGYSTGDDIENLKDLQEKDLRAMGIHKRAHLKRLLQALDRLFYPKRIELQIRKTKGVIEGVQVHQLHSASESEFWKCLIKEKLKPVKVQLTQTKDLKQQLKSLRNTVLAILLLVNLMWIILLYTLTFPRLIDYDLPVRAFSLIFLAVYGVIFIIQFFTLICHRVVTLIHYLGRIRPEEIVTPSVGDYEFVHVSYRRPDNEGV